MAKKKFRAPVRTFIKARHFGGAQVPRAIVLHGTVSSDNAGTARDIANWWAGPTSPDTSAHYVTDPIEDIQCVGDHSVAYHCGFNPNTLGHEFCDEQAGPASRWTDADSEAILKRGATLDAELCLAYGIKPIRPTIAALKRKGPHGIYGHNDSRLAFGHTTHSDPRDFPWDRYLKMVRAEIKRLSAIKGTRHLMLNAFNVGSASFTTIRSVVYTADATALAECSDRGDVLGKLENLGYGVIRPTMAGAPATPLVYKKARLRLIREVTFKLLDSQNVGPGAGPDRNKPKYFVGGLFEMVDTGRRVLIGSVHNLASQGNTLRRRAALFFTNTLNTVLRTRRAATFIGGDWNEEQSGPSLAPLRQEPWEMTPPRRTHGRRSIDFWVYKDRKVPGVVVSLDDTMVISGGNSDHDALHALWSISVA